MYTYYKIIIILYIRITLLYKYYYNDSTNVEDILEDENMANNSLEDEKPD